MKFRLVSVAVIAALIFGAFFIQYSISQTPRPWRSFTFANIPSEISAAPGETVTIEGGAINTGWYWLGDFHLSVSGLPKDYNYTITPDWFETLRILREWNSKDGVYRIPQNFTLKIKVPENASGVQLVNITGQELRSWYKFSNSTQFMLKVSSTPSFKITDLVFPESVKQYQSFDLTFTVKNEGAGTGTLSMKIDAPSDWNVSERSKTVTLNSGENQSVAITITPTNTSGNINIFADYPYRGTIINITQNGPFLTPIPVEMPGEEIFGPTGFAGVLEFFKGLGPIVIGIGIILLIVIVWNIWGIYKSYNERKEPEEMKEKSKTAEVSDTNSSKTIPEL